MGSGQSQMRGQGKRKIRLDYTPENQMLLILNPYMFSYTFRAENGRLKYIFSPSLFFPV